MSRVYAPNKGKGKTALWLKGHAGYRGDDCLIWPFCRLPTGYGNISYLGKSWYAHRLMCEMVHGPAPSPKHYASHNCGKGHEGCVNPRHLAWKTSQENAMDRIAHGNNWKKGDRWHVLDPEKVAQIRALKGKKTQYELAAMFGVSRQTISHIYHGRVWAREGVL